MLAPGKEISGSDRHLLALIEKIQQPISLTLRYKRPTARDTIAVMPFIASVDVHAVESVCECNNTFSIIDSYLREQVSIDKDEIWSDAKKVCGKIADFCSAFESIKFSENKRPGVLPVIKLQDRS